MDRAEMDRVVDRLEKAEHRRARTHTDGHERRTKDEGRETNPPRAGLVLVVPVGIDLKLFEGSLRYLEMLLQDDRAEALPGGTVEAGFWLEALKKAELRAGAK